MIQEAVQKAVAQARAEVKVETFNLDGSPTRATDSAEPPPQQISSVARPSIDRGRKPWPPPCRRLPFRCRNCRRWPACGWAPPRSGIRYQGRTDVVMMEVPAGSTVAGVFTSNKCPGAPVDWCRDALARRQGARWWW